MNLAPSRTDTSPKNHVECILKRPQGLLQRIGNNTKYKLEELNIYNRPFFRYKFVPITRYFNENKLTYILY